MEPNYPKAAPSEAHSETMDFLSREWCNFALQALQPPELHDRSIVLLDNTIKNLEKETGTVPFTKMEKSVKMDDAEFKSIPPWKSNDVKSWIWMQQAMHPELNYTSCFRKKWQVPWKNMVPFKGVSLKKWLKEIKSKRKEEVRLQRAEVHAAVSVAGVAAALAAIAAESLKKNKPKSDDATKEAAVASAAALVAAQCAQVAEAMGAKKEQISSIMSSATSGTSASDILTLTAAATTSLKGAATLKARSGCKNRLNGTAPVLPIEDASDLPMEFEKSRLLLAKGAELGVETPDAKYKVRSVSVVLNNEAQVILKVRKLNLLKSKKESVVLDVHTELYRESECDEEEVNTCYLLVLRTNLGSIKLDMTDDYQRYKTWASTINHMLMISTCFTKYQLQFYKN
ncbi:VAN3-binding protein isoform X1 [Carica papaya]|uniref:VAN3-binding protein isoform X1 n=1 Tax=Carica papaya TaxID=3649 RepID=UPI000B8C9451|nr:VAN3-binding protein isoform X1 [Carica papaya]